MQRREEVAQRRGSSEKNWLRELKLKTQRRGSSDLKNIVPKSHLTPLWATCLRHRKAPLLSGPRAGCETAAFLSQTSASLSQTAASLSQTSASLSQTAASLSQTSASLSQTSALLSQTAASLSNGMARRLKVDGDWFILSGDGSRFIPTWIVVSFGQTCVKVWVWAANAIIHLQRQCNYIHAFFGPLGKHDSSITSFRSSSPIPHLVDSLTQSYTYTCTVSGVNMTHIPAAIPAAMVWSYKLGIPSGEPT